jgi:hypothetical protein
MMTRDRFQKILLMLSAPTPGEVFNAAQLLGSFLKENGYDWFDFAAKVSEDFKGISETKAEQPQAKKSTRKKQPVNRWYRSRSGNLTGEINGQKCTIFRSKDNPFEFVAVINMEDGETRWERGFMTEELAQNFIFDNY